LQEELTAVKQKRLIVTRTAIHGGAGGARSFGGEMTKVLVVDDELRICRFVARSIEAHGFQVDSAATAFEAMRLAATNDYALIILDLLLPDFDGYEVLRRVVEANPAQRVLVLSAVGDVESRVRCLRLGAVDYLAKPFAIAELVERVKHRIDQQSTVSLSRWLDVGGVRLDLQRRVLRVGERVILLSPREFVLMEHLMRHANEVCTRIELLGDVWGYSFDPGSNVVDVCVGRLRAKLERDLIETVRNVGYCFIAS
jgi:two-component system copper resistance phosphate regulon response regulator CusR